MPTWIESLKIWNKEKPTWCIPRKDTTEYQQVRKIMGTGKQGKKLSIKPKKTQEPKNPAKKDYDEPPVKPKKIEIKYERYQFKTDLKHTFTHRGYRTYYYEDGRLKDRGGLGELATLRDMANRYWRVANQHFSAFSYNTKHKIIWFTVEDLMKVISEFKPGEKYKLHPRMKGDDDDMDVFYVEPDFNLDLSNKTNKTLSPKKKTPTPKKTPIPKKSPAPKKLFSEWYDFILPLSSGSVENIRGKEDDIIEICTIFLEKGKGHIDANMIKITKDVLDLAKRLKARRTALQKTPVPKKSPVKKPVKKTAVRKRL